MEIKSNSLVPELSVTDIAKSLKFYTEVLGFSVRYKRPSEGFAYIYLGESQIMLDQVGLSRTWTTGELEEPFGRGVNFQILVNDIEAIKENIVGANVELFLDIEEKWYKKDDTETGNKQFLVQDPDGYLLRFYQNIGNRKLI